MLKKFKDMVGIEGVKLKLEIPTEVKERDHNIKGTLYFLSKRNHTVSEIQLRLIEKYSRGRGDQKLTDEYELSTLTFERSFEIEPDIPMELDFELPLKLVKSEMDQFEGKFFIGRLATAAKYFRAVKSEFRVEAEAKVKGSLLNPFTVQDIRIKR
ncbi:MAG: sporulation protein [Saprospiraceae bacterium]|nr:sporulation protein [Saprospiraceae bacterium]